MRAVRQARQRIRHRQPFQILFDFLAFGDVDHAGHEAGFIVDHDGPGRQQRIANGAITTAQTAFEIIDRLPLSQPGEQIVAYRQVDIGLLDIGQRHGATSRMRFQRGAVDPHDAAVIACH